MPDPAAIYQYRTDNTVGNATITIDGTEPDDLTNYGVGSLYDERPGRVAKIESTTGGWLLDYGVAGQILRLLGAIHHTFDEAITCRIRAGTTTSVLDFTGDLVVPPWLGTGVGRWPDNFWGDLTEMAGWSATAWRYWHFGVVGNSQNLQLGQLWLSETIRRLSPDVQWGYSNVIDKPIIEKKTAWKNSTIYNRNTSIWSMDGELLMNQALHDALEQQSYNVGGRAFPWLFIPDGLINRCYFVRWTEMMWRKEHLMDSRVGSDDVWRMRFAVEEVARGLRPGV